MSAGGTVDSHNRRTFLHFERPPMVEIWLSLRRSSFSADNFEIGFKTKNLGVSSRRKGVSNEPLWAPKWDSSMVLHTPPWLIADLCLNRVLPGM